jgi:hypothetical protein
VLPLVPQLADGERTRLQSITLHYHCASFIAASSTLAVGTFSTTLQPNRIQNTNTLARPRGSGLACSFFIKQNQRIIQPFFLLYKKSSFAPQRINAANAFFFIRKKTIEKKETN